MSGRVAPCCGVRRGPLTRAVGPALGTASALPRPTLTSQREPIVDPRVDGNVHAQVHGVLCVESEWVRARRGLRPWAAPGLEQQRSQWRGPGPWRALPQPRSQCQARPSEPGPPCSAAAAMPLSRAGSSPPSCSGLRGALPTTRRLPRPRVPSCTRPGSQSGRSCSAP